MPGLLKSTARCPVCERRLVYVGRLTKAAQGGRLVVEWEFHHEIDMGYRAPRCKLQLRERESGVLSRRLHEHDRRKIRKALAEGRL